MYINSYKIQSKSITYHNFCLLFFFFWVELEDGQSHSDIPAMPQGNTEKEPYKQLGLTKEVLVAHTQKEENDFLSGFMDVKRLSAFQTRCNTYMHEKPGGESLQ